MDKNAFYKYVESRGQSGYGAALLVKEPSEIKYSLLIASTSVPSVQGSNDSFEFDLLNSPSKGKIMGKSTLDDKEVEFLLHRDNVYRLEKLKGQTLDFMYFTPDFMGWHFTGTIKYRPNDAGADVLMGTYVISPMSADESPIMDASSMVKETLCFKNAIPESVNTSTSIDVSVIQNATASYVVKKYNATTGAWDTESDITVSNGSVSFLNPGLYAVTASADNYAPWTTTVRVVSAT
jgi:hypothetical protein